MCRCVSSTSTGACCGCYDIPEPDGCFDRLWMDEMGDGCANYVAGQWCTSDGAAGPGWNVSEWGDYAAGSVDGAGVSAKLSHRERGDRPSRRRCSRSSRRRMLDRSLSMRAPSRLRIRARGDLPRRLYLSACWTRWAGGGPGRERPGGVGDGLT